MWDGVCACKLLTSVCQGGHFNEADVRKAINIV